MAYDPPSFETARALLLDEYRAHINGADVSPKSEIFARASVGAGAVALLAHGVKYVERQVFPDTADSDNLERHAGLYGLERKDATAASGGTIELSGTNGTVVAAGLVALHADGTAFETTSGGVIAAGILVVAAIATTTGSAGNKVTGDALTVQSPPVGVQSDAEVASDFSGGTDEESDAELLDRVLVRMRAGSAGGTATDYEQWALSINGVVAADCLALRRGAGTVSVAIYEEGPGGYRSAAAAPLRATVLAYLNTVRPVTADVDVPAVTEVSQDVDVEILEYEVDADEAATRTAVETAIKDYIYGLGTGETLYLAQLSRAIAAVEGVRDFDIAVPTDNEVCTVSTTAVEIFVPGAVTVS